MLKINCINNMMQTFTLGICHLIVSKLKNTISINVYSHIGSLKINMINMIIYKISIKIPQLLISHFIEQKKCCKLYVF